MFRSERGRYRGQQVVLTGLIPWLLFISMSALAEGTLTDNLRIRSKVLGYDLQYRVYLPQAGQDGGPYPVLFMTDGQNYLGRGHMDQVLDRETGKGSIRPVIAVFVDPRDPDDPETNRRRQQFLCNAEYFQFYVEELIPAIEASYPVIRDRTGRTIMGVSFGGTNAACFGALGSETYSGLVMQSPANHPVPNLLPVYAQLPTLPLKIFLSTGTPDDNTEANREFHALLQDKAYPMKYVEVDEGHDWNNWGPLLDDVLVYFYGVEAER
jgi:enterochelin esterase-like enzyme